MITFVKLGGSLITDKTRERSFRKEVTQRLAQEIQAARAQISSLDLVLGHGSGSFGHYAASRHNTIHGVYTPEQWRGFAEVAAVASELSNLVVAVFQQTGVPIWRLQPSASALCTDGEIINMNYQPIAVALDKRIVPMIHGDVCLDETIGGTIISTETIFKYLALKVPVSRIILLGEVDGVYDQNKRVIPQITPQNYSGIEVNLGGSRGTDVTGGMLRKVQDMLHLAQTINGLEIYIANGTQPNRLKNLLLGNTEISTQITAS